MKKSFLVALEILALSLCSIPLLWAGTVKVSGDGSDFYKVAFNNADAQFSLVVEDEPRVVVPTLSQVFIQEGAVAVFGGTNYKPITLVPEGKNSAQISSNGMIESWENVNLRAFGLESEPVRVNIVVKEGEPLVLTTNHGVKEIPPGFFSSQFAGGVPQIFDTSEAIGQLGVLEIEALEAFFLPGSRAGFLEVAETPQMKVAKGATD